jgi:hypothetical protein
MAKQRRTIGASPFDTLIPAASTSKDSAQPVAPSRPVDTEVPVRVEKERLTVHLPVDLIDRAKNAVYWTPGLTLAGLAEEAFRKALLDLERENGGPYKQRPHELRGGRPIK